ncbi:MAG: hypothetical protein NXI30_23595 [bacterium]|nr:hypothetical protein [bacterium]
MSVVVVVVTAISGSAPVWRREAVCIGGIIRVVVDAVKCRFDRRAERTRRIVSGSASGEPTG